MFAYSALMADFVSRSVAGKMTAFKRRLERELHRSSLGDYGENGEGFVEDTHGDRIGEIQISSRRRYEAALWAHAFDDKFRETRNGARDVVSAAGTHSSMNRLRACNATLRALTTPCELADRTKCENICSRSCVVVSRCAWPVNVGAMSSFKPKAVVVNNHVRSSSSASRIISVFLAISPLADCTDACEYAFANAANT